MNILHRESVTQGDGWDFVLSDGSRDRHGTRINPDGWDLSAFRKNPQALWAHGRDSVWGARPIGRWENVRVQAGKLIGRLVLAVGADPFIDGLRVLVEQGFLRATSVGFSVIKAGDGRIWEYDQQELHEASLVGVGSNPNALKLARSLNISPEAQSIIFAGEQAKGDMSAASVGGHAVGSNVDQERARVAARPTHRNTGMRTLSQRIEDAQQDLNAKRDRLAGLSAADTLDLDAIEALNGEVEAAERTVAALKASEARIGMNAGRPGAPAIVRQPLGMPAVDVKAADLIVRAALCHFVARATNKGLDQVLEARYPGHEPTALVTRADATVATTTTSGWASQLVQNSFGEFLQLLAPFAIYPRLADRGIRVNFNNNQGSITIPSSSSDTALAGGFVLEGDPIPVGRMTLSSITMAPHKFGIITTMTKEAAAYSTPALEQVLRNSILRRTGITLDGLLLDATAGSTTRPAGLLNGVSAVAMGYGGGDYQAVVEDINALMAPFDTANAGRNMVLIMHPSQARKLAMMPGPDGTFGWADRFLSQFTVLVSTNATARRLIAIDAEDFASAAGDMPTFDVSEQAVLHMSDAPGEIVTAAGSVNDPIRSLWQTNSLALRMIINLTWKMRRSGMVQWIDTTTW